MCGIQKCVWVQHYQKFLFQLINADDYFGPARREVARRGVEFFIVEFQHLIDRVNDQAIAVAMDFKTDGERLWRAIFPRR